MKKPWLSLVLIAPMILTGCVAAGPPGTVYVSAAPPAPLVEVSGVAPGVDFVWIDGYHQWDGTRYIWVGGRWERRPQVRAVWVPGHWKHYRRGGWRWTQGHWK